MKSQHNKVGVKMLPPLLSGRTIARNLAFTRDRVESHHDTPGTGRPFSKALDPANFPGARPSKSR
jgi:hypothetical protein